jgi:hypothetical protein
MAKERAMAQFHHIAGHYINPDQILFIKETSSGAEGPMNSCVIYFAGDKSIYLEGQLAASMARQLSSK